MYRSLINLLNIDSTAKPIDDVARLKDLVSVKKKIHIFLFKEDVKVLRRSSLKTSYRTQNLRTNHDLIDRVSFSSFIPSFDSQSHVSISKSVVRI